MCGRYFVCIQMDIKVIIADIIWICKWLGFSPRYSIIQNFFKNYEDIAGFVRQLSKH